MTLLPGWRELPWEIVWTRTGRAGWRRLPGQMQARVVAALERYAASGYGDLDRMAGVADQARLRVGDWRVRFRSRIEGRPADDPDEGEVEVRIVEVLIVEHRSRVYRNL